MSGWTIASSVTPSWMVKTYDGSKTKGVDADGHPHFIIKDANIITAFGSQKPDGSSASSHKETLLFQRFMNNDTYDWSKQVLRTAAQQNHFISANGATETTSYRLGMGYQRRRTSSSRTTMSVSTSRVRSIRSSRKWSRAV